MIVPVPNMWLL